MNKSIEVRKGELISEEYIEHKKQEAIALLKFRHPNCKIIIEEQDKKIIVTAVEKTAEEKKVEKAETEAKVKNLNEKILKLKLPEGDER